MAKRDSFLLRVDPRVLDALRKWADDEMRSINGQIEYLLRGELRRAGRLKPDATRSTESTTPEGVNDKSDSDGESSS